MSLKGDGPAAVLALAAAMLARSWLPEEIEVRASAVIELIAFGAVFYLSRKWLAGLLGED